MSSQASAPASRPARSSSTSSSRSSSSTLSSGWLQLTTPKATPTAGISTPSPFLELTSSSNAGQSHYRPGTSQEERRLFLLRARDN